MPQNHYCPNCGRKLEQNEYGFDPNTGNLHVSHCPDCGEIGSVVNDAEQAAKKYCKENIEDFELRYNLALDIENRMRCPLQHADNTLYSKISDKLDEWCEENGENPEDFGIEDMF